MAKPPEINLHLDEYADSNDGRGIRPATHGGPVTDLIDFLTARLDEDEQVAQGADDASAGRPWEIDTGDPIGAFLGHNQAARALREVAAKRAILDMFCDRDAGKPVPHEEHYPDEECPWCDLLRTLTSVYADHPDYQPEWSQQ